LVIKRRGKKLRHFFRKGTKKWRQIKKKTSPIFEFIFSGKRFDFEILARALLQQRHRKSFNIFSLKNCFSLHKISYELLTIIREVMMPYHERDGDFLGDFLKLRHPLL
jgi:hypothetical protein